MPPPINLTGRRFGRLRVVGPAGRVKFGREQTGWLCRCECGAELIVPQDRLPHKDWIARMRGRVVDACPACRGNPCVVCGAQVSLSGDGHGRRVTCSPACEESHRKARQRANWGRRVERDPALPRKMRAQRLAKAAADPDYATKLAEWERRRRVKHQERIRTDPTYREQFNSRQRDRYAARAEEIQTRRRTRLRLLSPEEFERRRQRMLDYQARHLDRVRADPDWSARRREYQAEYRRRRTEERAAIQIAEVAADLATRPVTVRPCDWCGGSIVGRKAQARYCSVECGRAAVAEVVNVARRKLPTNRTCAQCGRPFTGRNNAVTCSPDCARERKNQTKREARR